MTQIATHTRVPPRPRTRETQVREEVIRYAFEDENEYDDEDECDDEDENKNDEGVSCRTVAQRTKAAILTSVICHLSSET